MKTQALFLISLFFVVHSINAQVLYSQNFDNYWLGIVNVNNGLPCTFSGIDDWLTCGGNGNDTNFRVIQETNRGRVILIETDQTPESQPLPYVNRMMQKDISKLANSRNPQNNILKLEYDFSYRYNSGKQPSEISIALHSSKPSTLAHQFGTSIRADRNDNEIYLVNHQLGYFFTPPIYATPNTWMTVIIYVDFDSGYIYVEIPSLNYVVRAPSRVVNGLLPSLVFDDLGRIYFYISTYDSYSNNTKGFLKIDNIVISAVNTLPKLSNEELSASKFNLFPNPTNDIINITNNENIKVEQIDVFNISGKLVRTQIFNHETELQMNISDLGSGTYMFHISTTEGTVVKKVHKK